MANNTGIIIGVSVVAVLGIVITIVVVKSKSAPAYPPYNPNQYPLGYNPRNFPPGYNQQTANANNAALYTGAASVINNVLDTFFSKNNSDGSTGSYSGLSGQQMEDSYTYGNYTDNDGTTIYTDHG